MADLTNNTGGTNGYIGPTALATGLPAAVFDTATDREIYTFKCGKYPLLDLVLRSKITYVDSPEAEYYAIDRLPAKVTITKNIEGNGQFVTDLFLNNEDKRLLKKGMTLNVYGVNGYDELGREEMPGTPFQLVVQGVNPKTGNVMVSAVNGPSANMIDHTVPSILKDSICTIVAPALHETEKPFFIGTSVGARHKIYLQKRGLSAVVSDYFEAQEKRVSYGKKEIAEQLLSEFKAQSNRTFWCGVRAKKRNDVGKLGEQTAYFCEGVFNQISHNGLVLEILPNSVTKGWLAAMSQLFFTQGTVKPQHGILFAGSGLMTQIATADLGGAEGFVRMGKTWGPFGWPSMTIESIYGEITVVHDPAMDELCWNNYGAVISEENLERYVYREQKEHSDTIEGEEAKNQGVTVWDAPVLKGDCHILLCPKKTGAPQVEGTPVVAIWDSPEMPDDAAPGDMYFLVSDCPGISEQAFAGNFWQLRVEVGANLRPIMVWQKVDNPAKPYDVVI